jgi:signal transduction histidine kinase
MEDLARMDLVEETEKMVTHACTEERRISHNMMPGALINLGLIEAMEDFFDDVMQEHTLQIEFSAPEEEISCTEAQSINLYRIVQEATQNVLKHAHASRLLVDLSLTASHIMLQIQDDGQGFEPQDKKFSPGIGLRNIASRVKYLEGTMQIDSAPNQGCRFRISIPRQGTSN